MKETLENAYVEVYSDSQSSEVRRVSADLIEEGILRWKKIER